MYRTATHPEYVREVIVPALAEAGLPVSLAPAVAALVDGGASIDGAIRSLRAVLASFAAPGGWG